MPAKTEHREFAQARGNRVVLLLANSVRVEYAYLPLTVYRALEHWGVPFRVLDLAWERPDEERLANCAAVLVAQEHLGTSLRPSDAAVLLRAVGDGLGLVNLDFDLAGAPTELLDGLGLEGAGPGGRVLFDGLTGVGIRTDQHYITGTRPGGTLVRTRLPIAYCLISPSRPETTVLAESEGGGPVLLTGRLGRGRLVQWTVSPRIWLEQYLGFTHGLDDLLWRSIAWVARKPFLMKAMPPFIRMRFDDCNGFWREAADLAFLDHFVARGHRPNVSLNVRSVQPSGAVRIAELHRAGQADFAAHILDAQTSAWFKCGERAYTTEEMRAVAEEVDAAFARFGVPQSRVLSDHLHEFGDTALPYLRARGIRYKMNINLPNEPEEGLHVDWRPAPYGSMNYAFDEQPVSGMFVAFNHFPTFGYLRTYLDDGRHFYLNRVGGVGELKWDFLNGLTRSTRPEGGNDVERAARRLADHTARGLDSLFFGGSISHSHFLRDLSPPEWDRLLDRFDQLTARHAKRYASYDEICEYAESKVNTTLESVDVRSDGSLTCAISGRATLPLQLYRFVDRDDQVEYAFECVPPLHGHLEVQLSADQPSPG